CASVDVGAAGVGVCAGKSEGASPGLRERATVASEIRSQGDRLAIGVDRIGLASRAAEATGIVYCVANAELERADGEVEDAGVRESVVGAKGEGAGIDVGAAGVDVRAGESKGAGTDLCQRTAIACQIR